MNQNENSDPAVKDFKYILNDGQTLLIVQLIGHVSYENVTEIQSLSGKIREFSEAKFVVLDMSQVVEVESKMIFSFAKTQKDIRDSGLNLRICSLQPKLRKKLTERGVIRESEFFENLTLAVKSLVAKTKTSPRRNDPIAA